MECILWFCWHRSFSLHSELGWVSSCVENLKLFCSFGSLRVFIPFLQCDGSILLMLSWVVWIEMLNVSYVLGFLADTTFQAMITCLKHLNIKKGKPLVIFQFSGEVERGVEVVKCSIKLFERVTFYCCEGVHKFSEDYTNCCNVWSIRSSSTCPSLGRLHWWTLSCPTGTPQLAGRKNCQAQSTIISGRSTIQ